MTLEEKVTPEIRNLENSITQTVELEIETIRENKFADMSYLNVWRNYSLGRVSDESMTSSVREKVIDMESENIRSLKKHCSDTGIFLFSAGAVTVISALSKHYITAAVAGVITWSVSALYKLLYDQCNKANAAINAEKEDYIIVINTLKDSIIDTINDFYSEENN